MPFINTDLPGLIIWEPRVLEDQRGYFYESYNRKTFKDAGLNYDFVQDNQALSSRGVLRGLHYQLEPFGQAKLVSVISGEVLDVAVDIRQGSPTFGRHFSLVISAENRMRLMIPRGFAHGYLVLSDKAEFCYKCDNYYSREHDAGIRFDDPGLGIDWQFDHKALILSEKDKALPLMDEAKNNFKYLAG